MGLSSSDNLPGKEGQALLPTPPPWICPLAAKGKGDRVCWAQLQEDQVGDVPSFLGKGTMGSLGWTRLGEGIRDN